MDVDASGATDSGYEAGGGGYGTTPTAPVAEAAGRDGAVVPIGTA